MKILAIVMSVAFFITAAWGYVQYRDKQVALFMLENQYQRTFYNLVDTMENVSLLSGKVQVVSSPKQRLVLLSQIQTAVNEGEEYLAALPLDNYLLSKSTYYLNQMSDYTGSLFKKVSMNQELTEEEMTRLSQFSKQLKDINNQLGALETKTGDGSIFFGLGGTNNNTVTNGRTVEVTSDSVTTTELSSAQDYFSSINDGISKFDTLTYDGAYSDHMQKLTAKGLAGGEELSIEKAQKIAEEFLQKAFNKKFALSNKGETGGSPVIPVHTFLFSAEEGDIYIGISKTGGKLISLFSSYVPQAADISTEEALKKAKDFIKQAGYDAETIITSQKKEDNTLLLELARKDKDITYYPDALKIKVALDEARVIAFDSSDYWTNYDAKRVLEDPTLLAEDAQAGLSKGFEVSGNGLALISDGCGNETLCHEFSGKSGDDEYKLYINTKDGGEEQILHNMTSEDGFYTR